MTSGSISLSNIQDVINNFIIKFNQTNRSFSKIEKQFTELKCENQKQKSEIKGSMNSIHNGLLRNLKRVDNCNEEEISNLKKYEGCLDRFKTKLSEAVRESGIYKETFLENYERLLKSKDSSILNETKGFSNQIKAHILRSRQTDHCFIMMKLKHGYKKCYGCNDLIPSQSCYLSHKEEYPSGSKSFRPHAYHIKQECFFRRGFQMKYLNKIPVTSNLAVDKDFNNILAEIGFQTKNISVANCLVKDSDSDSDNVIDSKDSDKEFPDNISDTSNVSSVSINISFSTFIYKKKPGIENIVIRCQGCQTNIETAFYISLSANSKSIPFHIHKNCLRTGDALPDNRSKCKVFNLLKTDIDLQELLDCGFSFHNIIGQKPQNQGFKKSPVKSTEKPKEYPRDNDCFPKNSTFIFNEEPFYCERLIYGEKCRGCNNQISKNDMSLRHQERVPREKQDVFPLTSQYYHVNKECLLKRGFTFKHLSFIQCKAILSGEDNLYRVTEELIRCGFYNEKIIFIQKEINEPRDFEAPMHPARDILENKLYIVNCTNSLIDCKGCGFILLPNQPCFMFSTTSTQNGNAKYFHIKGNCLKVHFTMEQIMATTCITNNLVDVRSSDIINCGIVKIESDSTRLGARSVTKQTNKRRVASGARSNHQN